MKDAAVVIVSWNKKELLDDCLSSLGKQTYQDFQMVFVDNGSEDGSADFVEKNYPEAKVIRLKKNTGFAEGNNVGIAEALKDDRIRYIVTLNNDTKADSDYLEKLLECAKSHPKAGSIQPKVINFFDLSLIDSAGLLICPDMGAMDRGGGRKDGAEFQKEEEIFGTSASASLYLAEALKKTKLGGDNYFDGDYFAYYEDVDLAWRLRLAGYESYYCPEARVLHIHGASAKKFSSFQKFYIHRNHYFNIIKDLPMSLVMKTLVLMVARYFLVAKSIFRKKGSAAKLVEDEGGQNIAKIVPKVWWGVVRNIPALLRKRKLVREKTTVKKKEIESWFKKFKAEIGQSVYGQ